MRKVVLAAVVTTACVAMSGCFAVGTPFDDGRFMMVGDAEGIRAFSDYQNGLTRRDDSYFRHRSMQEQEKTRRQCSRCGFMQKLFGPSEEPQGEPKLEERDVQGS